MEYSVVEVVDDTEDHSELVHYLPQHPVVRENKSTTKLRIVYDTSAKALLNDHLCAEPNFNKGIMDILFRFWMD